MESWSAKGGAISRDRLPPVVLSGRAGSWLTHEGAVAPLKFLAAPTRAQIVATDVLDLLPGVFDKDAADFVKNVGEVVGTRWREPTQDGKYE